MSEGTAALLMLKGLSTVELAKIFVMGKCPRAVSLLGPHGSMAEWRVDMLTGPIPNLGGRWFRHRKTFYPSKSGRVLGCNVFFANLRWGWFVLDDYDVYEEVDNQLMLFVDYKQPENGCLTRGKIRDYVRTTDDPNQLLGEFYYDVAGRSFGPWYFSLTRCPSS